ncbi:PLAC8 family protein [Achlya hypogyna]|uniref:PLAC8 family protein n=1 Tax=Achlya hypogyna TaxID=1202772 RepID=A0A1V9YD42_ACHHY|nr:PLAC8 family protein [Achlya hypogyna]
MEKPTAYDRPPAAVAVPLYQATTALPVATMAPHGRQFWRVGVFECTDVYPNVILAWCCPCVALAQITARLGIFGGYSRVLYGVGSVVALSVVFSWASHATELDDDDDAHRQWRHATRHHYYALLSYACFFAAGVFLAVVRTRVRSLHQIEGSEIEDFACALCCPCCTLAQTATEVQSYTPGVCSMGPPDTLPGYVAQA